MLICNLALLAGAIGREGVGVNPLRGQNNVQGAADMGCQPDSLTGYQPVADAAVRARFEAAWGRAVPATPGRTLPRIYEAIRAGDIRGMFVFGEDVIQTDPDMKLTRATIEKLEFLVVQELFLSETAKLAHVVLPAASFLEKDGTFTNGERRVQRVRRAVAPGRGREARLGDPARADEGAPAGEQPFTHPSQVMDESPRCPARWPASRTRDSKAMACSGRCRTPGIPARRSCTPSRSPRTRAAHVRGVGALAVVRYALTLVTGRAFEHYNAGTMTRRTANVEIVSEDVLEISPADAAARGITDGDRVRVKSAQGEAGAAPKSRTAWPPGTVFTTFHFPEACVNALTSEVRDRLCDCPEYKVTAVEVERSG